MPRDNSPKERYQHQLARKQNKRAPYDRILIVCEGSKTEPNYLKEIKSHYRLHSANVQIFPSIRTSPSQVIERAEKIFTEGDPRKGIAKRAFEQVYAVFDRDDHPNFFDALTTASDIDGRLRNDNKRPISFKAIPSNPCFELWLLLHFEDISALCHRNEVLHKLKKHYPEYEKNTQGVWERTKEDFETALTRASKLMENTSLHKDDLPYTAVGDLVRILTKLKP